LGVAIAVTSTVNKQLTVLTFNSFSSSRLHRRARGIALPTSWQTANFPAVPAVDWTFRIFESCVLWGDSCFGMALAFLPNRIRQWLLDRNQRRGEKSLK